MKAMSLLSRCFSRTRPVEEKRLLGILGRRIAFPVSITFPVIPSPMWYLPFGLFFGPQALGLFDAICPLPVKDGEGAARDLHMLGRSCAKFGFSAAFRSRVFTELDADIKQQGEFRELMGLCAIRHISHPGHIIGSIIDDSRRKYIRFSL